MFRFKVVCAFVTLLAVFCAFGKSETVVRVSDFGCDREDSTRFIQAALDSGADRVIFDRKERPWFSTAVFARSNTEIVFEEGVELVAKRGAFKLVRGNSLFSLECATNVIVRGLGRGATLRMWKRDYQDRAQYEPSEWRHALNVMSSKNILVENMSFVASGGDGIYLGVKTPGCANTDVTIRNCVCDDNHRQGISVISAENLLIENVVMKNTGGALPESGIDFEPNSADEKIVNCVLRKCTTLSNRGAGYEMSFGMVSGKTEPVTITLENCRSLGDKRPAVSLGYSPFCATRGFPRGGFLKVKGCSFKNSQSSAVMVYCKPRGVSDICFEDCVFENCPVNDPHTADVRLLANGRMLTTDGVSFRNVMIRRRKGGDWLQVTNCPWSENGISDISGEVTLEEGDERRLFLLDDAWRRSVMPVSDQKFVLSKVPFKPSVAEVVDKKPGERVKLSPLKLRFSCESIFYAAKPGPIRFAAKISVVKREKPLAGKPFVITDLDSGKTLAQLAAPTEKVSDFVFHAPKAGFYRLACDVKPHALVFVECDVPIGFLPPGKNEIDVFTGDGDAWFFHKTGVDSTFFFAGGISEYVTARLFDPSDEPSGEWKNLSEWGFRRLAPDDPSGLWRINLSQPDRGFIWEDSFLDRTGEPAVFFLTNEKYWK